MSSVRAGREPAERRFDPVAAVVAVLENLPDRLSLAGPLADTVAAEFGVSRRQAQRWMAKAKGSSAVQLEGKTEIGTVWRIAGDDADQQGGPRWPDEGPLAAVPPEHRTDVALLVVALRQGGDGQREDALAELVAELSGRSATWAGAAIAAALRVCPNLVSTRMGRLRLEQDVAVEDVEAWAATPPIPGPEDREAMERLLRRKVSRGATLSEVQARLIDTLLAFGGSAAIDEIRRACGSSDVTSELLRWGSPDRRPVFVIEDTVLGSPRRRFRLHPALCATNGAR